MKFSYSACPQNRERRTFVDAVIHALHIPARLYLLPLSWYLLVADIGLLAKSLAVATIVSAIYAVFFLRSEKSTETFRRYLRWFAFLTLQVVILQLHDRIAEQLDDAQSRSLQRKPWFFCWLSTNTLSLMDASTMDTQH